MSKTNELRKRKIINDAYSDFFKVLINQGYENINKYRMECKPYSGSIYEIAKLISAKGKKKKSIKRKSKKQKSKKRRSTKKVLTRRVKQK
tara:strand:+ start:591 stop:860 length:270 start_codon:yes stop_codon:yes gene_type:complete